MPQLGDCAAVTCPDTPLMLIGREPGPDGSYGRVASGAPLPRDPTDPALWLPGQGRANSCGTTTLAYILRYLLGPNRAPSSESIDRAMRRGNIFSAPLLLVAYASRLGLQARAYNGASLDLIFGLVDRGIPVMALTDTTPLNLRDTANLHWVAVVGHQGERVAIYNPHGFQEELDLDSFRAHWREARLFGLPAWRNLAIAVARPGQLLPPGGGVDLSFVGANLAADGVALIVNRILGAQQRAGQVDSPRSALLLALSVLGVPVAAMQTIVGALALLAGAAWRRRR